MDAPNTENTQVARVPREHFKRWRLLQDWKWLLTAIAVLLVFGWWLTRFFAAEGHARSHSPGDLAHVHATWDNRCETCHDPFTPLQSHAWFSSHSGPAGVNADSQKCKTCHAGPAHQTDALRPGDEASCGSCHRDHRGRDASLVRVADAECLRCHRELANHQADGRQPVPNVTTFIGGHPQFKLYAPLNSQNDPGKVKFNHALHMTAGLTTGAGKNPWRLSNLAVADRQRYGPKGENDALVQLDCASCHQLDSGDREKPAEGGFDAVAPLPARSAGAYMLPISYDNHCKACHPLTLDADATVPHRVQPPELRLFLQGLYLDAAGTTEPAGGRVRPDHPPEAPGDPRARRALVGDKVAVAECRFYYGQTCVKCHYLPPDDEILGVPKSIVPTAVPDVWFAGAKFNHVAHRAFNCRECHARAYPDEPDASRKHTDVLVVTGPGGRLSGIALCQQCHAPATVADGQPRGGARFGCTECHTYHNGGDPHRLQGPGARARDPDRGSR